MFGKAKVMVLMTGSVTLGSIAHGSRKLFRFDELGDCARIEFTCSPIPAIVLSGKSML